LALSESKSTLLAETDFDCQRGDHGSPRRQKTEDQFRLLSFPVGGSLRQRRWVTSEKRRRHSRAFITSQSLENEKATEKQGDFSLRLARTDGRGLIAEAKFAPR
jgi:hypothetical protein